MTLDERVDRVERILVLFVKAGRRTRGDWRERAREQEEKIHMLIRTQMETSEQIMQTNEQIKKTTEQIKGFAADRSQAEKEMADLRRSQELTQQALRAFINSQRKGGNSESST